MGGDASAYAALGLKPGANAAAVEQAYKRLIKLHHPDREGGDVKRAAEITKAYRELRASMGSRDTLVLHDPVPFGGRQGRGEWVTAAVLVVGGVAALLFFTGPVAQLVAGAAPRLPIGQVAAATPLAEIMDQPIEGALVSDAAREARRMSREQDEMALTSASRECHYKFRTDPSMDQFDRCVAFDDAVIQLQDRDPLRDRGPFSELAVTGRHWSAASALSNDYLAIDSRLSRIRVQVELALAPSAAEPSAPLN